LQNVVAAFLQRRSDERTVFCEAAGDHFSGRSKNPPQLDWSCDASEYDEETDVYKCYKHEPLALFGGERKLFPFGAGIKMRPQRERHGFFWLPLQRFGAMIGKMTNGRHPRPATLWRMMVEAWLRCQGLIAIRQNQKQNVSTNFPESWA
jgi:hypothetical protein